MFKKILEAVKRWNPKLLESVDIANITEVEVTSIFESLVKTAKESNSNKTKELEAIVAKFKEKDYSEAETLLNALISMKEMTDKELLAADDSNLDPKNLKKKKDLLKKQAEAKDKTDQDVKNTDLEVMRGVESVFYRRHRDTGDFRDTIINLDKAVICRVIEPTHGRIITTSGDRRLLCGNKNDVLMQEHDWESEKESRRF